MIGILMSAPMVLAHLADRKTQTRRTRGLEDLGDWVPAISTTDGKKRFGFVFARDDERKFVPCPYGGPGGQLYIREGIRHVAGVDAAGGSDRDLATYIADGSPAPIDNWGWKNKALPAIHMPFGLRRFELDLHEVRVERLNAISEYDAMAEGLERRRSPLTGFDSFFGAPGSGMSYSSAVDAYRDLWESINGAGSWERNPWVWRLRYTPRRVR